jgi:glutamine amidotransferase
VLQTDDGVLVASEPTDDDPRWADVPDHHLVDVTGNRVTITELEI